MKLPTFSFGKKPKAEYFLALLLRDEKVAAVIFEEHGGKGHVVGEKEVEFIGSIETSPVEEWIDAIDKAVSSAEQRLPESIETRKTIFGVKEDWVEDAKIKKEYLVKLKKVSDTLGFTPIGFLVLSEAIAHLLSREEGAPVSAILVEIGLKTLSVSLLRAGKVAESKSSGIIESVVATVDTLLHAFTAYEVLPSRIIFFNTKDDEVLSQQFISHTWSRSIPFLHVPQVMPLPAGFDARAVLFGAATQMGFDMLGGDIPVVQEETKEREETQETKGIREKKGAEAEETELLDAAAFGFAAEEIVDEKKEGEEEKKEESPEEVTVDKDEGPVIHDRLGGEDEETETIEETVEETPVSKKHNTSPLAMFGSMKKRMTVLFAFLGRLPGGGKVVLIFPLILAIVLGIVAYYIFALKATAILTVNPKKVSKSQAITFLTDGATDFDKNIINTGIVSISLDGKLTVSTTGDKQVGDKAKGSVTLYSRLQQSKTFTAGTVISGPNNTTFALDKAVTVASSSADASATPTTATVNVTAKDIGKEANLPSGTKFSVDTYDIGDVVAKNDTAFSGGSKKDVTVVAQADIDKLTQELPKTLEDKAKSESDSKVSSGEEALPLFVNVSFDKKTFDKKVSEEAKTVTLTATVTYEKLSYKKATLVDFSKKLLAKDILDMALSKDGLTYEVQDVKQDAKKGTTATVVANASLVPKIDQGALAGKIAAQSFVDAETMLKKLPQVKDVAITLSPNFSFLPHLLPRMAKNITITISDE